jgi:hypothetical protein
VAALRPRQVFFLFLAKVAELAARVEGLLAPAVAAVGQAADLAAQRECLGADLDSVGLPVVAGAFKPGEVGTLTSAWWDGLRSLIINH